MPTVKPVVKNAAFALLAALVVVVALAGCASAPSPSTVAKETLDAIKAQDFEKMKSHYAGSVDDVSISSLAGHVSGFDVSSLSEEDGAMVKELIGVMTSFDYELGTEAINGDTATVDATISTYDLGTVFSEAMGDYFTDVVTNVLSGGSIDEAEMKEQFIAKFKEKLAQHTEKTHTEKVTLNLTKTDGEWKMDSFDEQTVDAFMGGLISSAKSFTDQLESLGSAL